MTSSESRHPHLEVNDSIGQEGTDPKPSRRKMLALSIIALAINPSCQGRRHKATTPPGGGAGTNASGLRWTA